MIEKDPGTQGTQNLQKSTAVEFRLTLPGAVPLRLKHLTALGDAPVSFTKDSGSKRSEFYCSFCAKQKKRSVSLTSESPCFSRISFPSICEPLKKMRWHFSCTENKTSPRKKTEHLCVSQTIFLQARWVALFPSYLIPWTADAIVLPSQMKAHI